MMKLQLLNMDISRCLLLAALILLPMMGGADNIYKYQDENGIWHFTDRAPDEGIEFETVFMQREPEPRIHMRQEGTKQSPVYLLFNDYYGPVEIEIKLTNAINVMSEPQLPARFVVPGQKEQVLVGLGPLDPGRGYQYRISMSSIPGPPNSQPVVDMVLLPPFAADAEYFIGQGFKGESTHLTPDSEFALDISMPVGSAVHAARDGIVMDVEEDFNRGGTDRDKFVDKANHVRILHDDGTMALYAHLDLASVNVRRGARVRAGQKIARSGNTGFSSGPHLHFAIQQNSGMQLISVPFQFKASDGTVFVPQERTLLKGSGSRL
jgi:hypothetical protein